MTKADLTIGFSTYMDYCGAVMTLQALRIYHSEYMPRCKILVVDQTPVGHKHAEDLKVFMNYVYGDVVGARYVSMPEPAGTSPGRHQLFELADTPYVLCIDSHIFLYPGALKHLFKYYDAFPRTQNLIQGILAGDDLQNYFSHMEPIWRGEMFGIWAMMWECPNCQRNFFTYPGVMEDNPKISKTLFGYSPISLKEIEEFNVANDYKICECGQEMPKIPYEGHEKKLLELGFKRPGELTPPHLIPTENAFEIPMHGLGLFTCRRDVWLKVGGFNRNFRGFGGEEGYIHKKIARNGGKTILLPQLRWWHRFGRPDGTQYNLAQLDKVRNYILGAKELGESIERVWKHFGEELQGNRLSRESWDRLNQMIDSGDYPPGGFTVRGKKQVQQTEPMANVTVEDLFERLKNTPRDLNEHLETIREYAKKCSHVTEFSERKESTIALLAANPQRLISYNMESNDPLFNRYIAAHKKGVHDPNKGPRQFVVFGKDSLSIDPEQFEETELLFIDSPGHNAERVREELKRFLHKVKRFLIFHDTVLFGEGGDNHGPGINYALRELVQDHPEWQPIDFRPHQYGLTVLSCRKHDHPLTPVGAWPVGHGPGTELKKILASLDINPSPRCDCNGKAMKMDHWGVQGCRENFAEIVQWMKDGQDQWGWTDKMKAAAKAVKTGLAFQIRWTDPFPDIIKQAIDNAEKEEEQVKQEAVKAVEKKEEWIMPPKE